MYTHIHMHTHNHIHLHTHTHIHAQGALGAMADIAEFALERCLTEANTHTSTHTHTHTHARARTQTFAQTHKRPHPRARAHTQFAHKRRLTVNSRMSLSHHPPHDTPHRHTRACEHTRWVSATLDLD